jgi:hypothetical protein
VPLEAKMELLETALYRRGTDVNAKFPPAIPALGEKSQYSLLQYALSPWIRHRVKYSQARRMMSQHGGPVGGPGDDPTTATVDSIAVSAETVKRLIEWGADVNLPADFVAPSASTLKRTDSALSFLADVHPRAPGGASTLLHFLCNGDLVHQLTRLSARDVAELMRICTRAGADLEMLDEEGRTPLTVAEDTSSMLVATILIEAGAKAQAMVSAPASVGSSESAGSPPQHPADSSSSRKTLKSGGSVPAMPVSVSPAAPRRGPIHGDDLSHLAEESPTTDPVSRK